MRTTIANATKTATKNSVKNARIERKPDVALDRRYGQIGISAVAAAARYQGDAKNPAYAPAPAGRYEDEAAW